MKSSDGVPQSVYVGVGLAVFISLVSLLVVVSRGGDDDEADTVPAASADTVADDEVTDPVETAPANVDTAQPTATAAVTTEPPPPEPAPTTTEPPRQLPTLGDVRDSLIQRSDLANPLWEQAPVDGQDICDEDPILDVAPVYEATTFGFVDQDAFVGKQVSSSIYAFADVETARSVFAADVQAIADCAGKTVVVDEVPSLVKATVEVAEPGSLGNYPCAEENASGLIVLASDDEFFPEIAVSFFVFRCGSNLLLTSLSATDGVDGLIDTDFIVGTSLANERVSTLAGST